MKRLFSLIALLLLFSLLLSCLVACGDEEEDEPEDEEEEEEVEIDESLYEYVETPYAGTTLTVYNWGEYISDGSEGTPDVIELFEQKYGIKVIYSTYATNEDLYAKLKSGSIAYDIVIPSEYMIAKFIEEDMLEKIDVTKLKNYHYIDERYRGQFYDPEEEYTVAYMVGMLGVIYNTTMVDEEDVEDESWGLLWNEKYRGDILTFDNSRDAFGIAQMYLGLDVNSMDKNDWLAAQEKLLEQRPLLEGYVMDEIFQTMEGGNAAIAAYYAGDCLSMMEENEDLAFYYPQEGTNIYIDAMCIPKGAPNYGAAMLFIDFMCEPDIATYNANYVCYASPHTAVLENDNYDYPEGTDEYEILYGTDPAYPVQFYHSMPNEMIEYYNRLFDEVKFSAENGTFYIVVLPVVAVVTVGAVVAAIVVEKKKRAPGKKPKA